MRTSWARLSGALTQVFDPAPERLAVPWGYLIALVAAAAVSIGTAVVGAQRAATRMVVENLREL